MNWQVRCQLLFNQLSDLLFCLHGEPGSHREKEEVSSKPNRTGEEIESAKVGQTSESDRRKCDGSKRKIHKDTLLEGNNWTNKLILIWGALASCRSAPLGFVVSTYVPQNLDLGPAGGHHQRASTLRPSTVSNSVFIKILCALQNNISLHKCTIISAMGVVSYDCKVQLQSDVRRRGC